jgi:hypothetical protein
MTALRITRGVSSFIVKTSVMSFGVPPTSIPQESKNCKIKYRNIFARNIPDVDHCNVSVLMYSVMPLQQTTSWRHVVKPKELRCAANASHDATSFEDVIWLAKARDRRSRKARVWYFTLQKFSYYTGKLFGISWPLLRTLKQCYWLS